MTSGREKRLLLGILAWLVPLPLPLNQVVLWPVVLLYLVFTTWFLYRAWEDRSRWLPFWAMNLLGLVYLPVFVLDLLVLSQGGLVGPVVHLALFTVVVKLFSLQRERDKWQALIGIFFLFLAGMATSVHPAVVIYLLAYLGLSLFLLARFACLHLMAGFSRDQALPTQVPLRGILGVSLLLSVLVAVPLFALLPRVRPYIPASRLGGPTLEVSGLSDEVTLDSIGRMRTSRAVALRIEMEDTQRYLETHRDSLRFKATTFDRYENDRWRRSPVLTSLHNIDWEDVPFELADEPPTQWAQVWLQPLNTRSLVLPLESSRIQVGFPSLDVSRGGSVVVSGPLRTTVLNYRVGLADRPLYLAPPPEDGDASLDLSGVTPPIGDLASRVMGEGGDLDRVRRLERHLQQEYEYTLDFVGRSTDDPIEEFLFRSQSGHCEYFASSMVLMLRSQGIPARLVTGYLGAESNFLQGYLTVRQENAHAWVEAYLEDEGRWETFDPTPAVGRPGLRRATLLGLAVQAYDYVLFRWDRYVLSYDMDDQISVFAWAREAWEDLWRWFEDEPAAPAVAEDTGESATAETPVGGGEVPEVPVVALVALSLALALGGAVWILWRRWRRPLTAVTAYQRLRWEMERDGLEVSAVDPPLAVKRAALSHWPEAADPAGRVFDLYVQESYAGRPLEDADREDLQQSLHETLRRLRKAG